MQNEFTNAFARVTEANRAAVESAMQFNKLAVRTQSLLASQQLAAAETLLEAGSRQLELVSEARDPKELMARQAELSAKFGEKLMAVAQEALAVQAQVRDEYVALVEEGIEGFKPEVTPAAVPKAAPKARTTKKTA